MELSPAGEGGLLQVEMVAFVDFDIVNGTHLSAKYPLETTFADPFTDQFLADCALPDGGHVHQTDQSYLIIIGPDQPPRYGIAFFRNKSDKQVDRGAVQRALLVVSRQPFFHLFEQSAYELLEYSIDPPEDETEPSSLPCLLSRYFRGILIEPDTVSTTSGIDNTQHHAQVRIFDHTHKLIVPEQYGLSRFDSVSLIRLIMELGVWNITLQVQRGALQLECR